MTYRSSYITETDEPRFTVCQFCAGLMLVADWTDGEAIADEHGNTLDAVGLKLLRERIRVLSGDTEGGASLDDLALGIAKRFPELPPLPRTNAAANPLTLTFDELWARLQGRWRRRSELPPRRRSKATRREARPRAVARRPRR